MIAGFLILLLCQLVGELLVTLFQIPVPGAVVGMVLLLVGLRLWGGVLADLRQSAEGLLKVLPLLLVPAGVGLMVHFELIAQNGLVILAALVISTFVTMLLVAALLKVARRNVPESGDGNLE